MFETFTHVFFSMNLHAIFYTLIRNRILLSHAFLYLSHRYLYLTAPPPNKPRRLGGEIIKAK